MSNNMSVTDRLKLYLKAEGISISTFEKECGFANGYIRGVKTPSMDKIEIILEHTPDLNRTWLLSGDGYMFLSDIEKEDNSQECSCDKCKEKDIEIARLKAELSRFKSSNDYIDIESRLADVEREVMALYTIFDITKKISTSVGRKVDAPGK